MKLLSPLLFLLATGSAFGQSYPTALKVGDVAPPIVPAAWRNGSVDFKDGKVHVVDFWATWCIPCRVGFPHLAALAKQYEGKVAFAAVDVMDTRMLEVRTDAALVAQADRFLAGAGGVLDFPVAIDSVDDRIMNAWLKSNGASGVPTTFVIDATGKVVWVGTPTFALDEVLSLVVAGRFTPEIGDQINQKAQLKSQLYSEYSRQADDAVKAGDWARAYAASKKLEKMDVPWPEVSQYVALLHHDRIAARIYGEKVLKKYGNSPLVLAEFAHATLADTSDEVGKDDYEFALRLLKAASAYLESDDPQILSESALAYHKLGDKVNAVKTQKALVKRLESRPALNYDLKEAQTTLGTYGA